MDLFVPQQQDQSELTIFQLVSEDRFQKWINTHLVLLCVFEGSGQYMWDRFKIIYTACVMYARNMSPSATLWLTDAFNSFWTTTELYGTGEEDEALMQYVLLDTFSVDVAQHMRFADQKNNIEYD